MKKTFLFVMAFLTLFVTGGILTACGDDDPEGVTPDFSKDTTEVQKPDTTQTEPVDTLSDKAAIGWPADYPGVMLQAFYWDSFDDSQWALLEQQADEFAGTFDLVWLPQSGYCGNTSMGYDDLYWFENYNSSFGNEQQLRSLIATLRQKGIKTIADVVINHRKNLSNWVDFPKETYNGVTYEMVSTDICSNDDGGKTKTWASQNGYELSANNDTGEGWDGMRDIDHKSENVQTIVKAYLNFLLKDLGYAGFRYDMVKGYSASYTSLYNAYAQPEFSVGECWDGTSTIKNWIVGTKLGTKPQSAAFDFQFRYTVRNAMNGKNYTRLGQQNDGNWPLVSSNQDQGTYRRYAVTFVENHDTERRSNAAQDPLTKDTLAANAYLLAMPGTPCVFLKHWQSYPSEIKAMTAARKQAGITNMSNYSNILSKTTCYANIIQTGNEDRLLVAVGDIATADNAVDNQKWVKVLAGYHYAYYLPSSLAMAYADLPSGTYEGEQQVRLSAVTSDSKAQLVYTTDGSTPTASSQAVSSGYIVSIPTGTTTLKVALLSDGKLSGQVSRTYIVKEKESEQPVEIPSFCTVTAGETCTFFEAPATWTDVVKCWAWTDTENFTGGSWPGQECTLLGTASNGNQVWKWSYAGTSTSQPTGIIFSNNGTPQTADLPFNNGGYYNKDGLKAVVTN
ncbi:MAG: starch-binding protein [Prevotella sp.]|nr:starch-binding protein [Prevotella sp.]